MLHNTSVCRPDYEALVAVVHGTSRLPAVATLDWADRAAATLALMAKPSRACVVICSVDDDGSVRDHETTGVATSTDGGVMRQEGMADRSPELTLRSRGERLDHVGFNLSSSNLEEGVFGTLDRLLQTSDWRSVGLGRLWAGVPAGEVLTGIVQLGGVAPGRALIAMVGMSHAEDDAVRKQRVAQLCAIMPGLSERAILAIGADVTNSTRWLTAREQQVLKELTFGKSVREIAEQIGRSPHTVHDHVKSLHRKLNASSRGELVARALGFLDDHDTAARSADSEATPITEVKATGASVEQMRSSGGDHASRAASGSTPNPAGPRPAVYIPSRGGAATPRQD